MRRRSYGSERLLHRTMARQYNLGVCYANGIRCCPGLRRGGEVVPHGRFAGRCRRTIQSRGLLYRGTGCRSGLVPSGTLVPAGLPNRIMRAPSITSADMLLYGACVMPDQNGSPPLESPPRPKRVMPMLSGHCGSSIDPVPRPRLVVHPGSVCLRRLSAVSACEGERPERFAP